MSAASVGFETGHRRQTGQILSGAMGMCALYSRSLGNSCPWRHICWLVCKFNSEGHVEQETSSYWTWTMNLEKNSQKMRQKGRMPMCLSLLHFP